MKIVKRGDPPHDCYLEAESFATTQSDLDQTLYVGSVLECPCGRLLKLIDTQRDGPIWQWLPGERD